jgi:hypothetical protein
MRTVLISGIPATGKTCFGNWLAHRHGFRHVDVEKGDGPHPGMEANGFLDAARAGHPDLVVTWGFPPNLFWISKIRALHAVGLVPWWFDGDRDAALDRFLERTGHPGTRQDWNAQMNAIEALWPALENLYGDRVIDAVRPGPAYMDREEIFSRMFLGTAS